MQVVVYNTGSNTLQPATLNGTIDMSGGAAAEYGSEGEWSGGGAGGTILIEASTITGNGVLNANGAGGGEEGLFL